MFIRLTAIYNFSSFVFFIEINLTDEDSNLSRNVWKYETLSLHFFWTLKPTKYTKNIVIIIVYKFTDSSVKSKQDTDSSVDIFSLM